jgi:hypothetical protein
MNSIRWYQAGWRPSIGWVCALALAVHYLVFPLASLVMPEAKSPVDGSALMALVTALLGLGSLRTVERIKDKA